MGYAATRTDERVAAALGLLSTASIEFCAGQDIAGGGVLLSVPALLAMGLLAQQEMFALPSGYYGLTSVFLLLALMALARIPSLEKLRYQASGEWGQLLGLDRIPEVRTLREKVKILCSQAGRAAQWNAALAKAWITAEQAAEPVFYADGHVRVYHGKLTDLPKHYVSRQKLYQRATVDYWINAMDGQPFCYINQPVDHGLVAALRKDLAVWVKANLVVSAEHQRRMDADPRVPLATIVVDREGYSPELFEQFWQERIAVITYHRYPKEDWPVEEFLEESVDLVRGVTVKWKLAQREIELGRQKVRVREVRRRTDDGRQISIVSTHFAVEGRRRLHADHEVGDVAIHQSFDAESIVTGPISLDRWVYSVNPRRQAMKFKAAIRADLGHLVIPSLIGADCYPHARRYRLAVAQHHSSLEHVGRGEPDIADVYFLPIVFGFERHGLTTNSTRRQRLHLWIQHPDAPRRNVRDRKSAVFLRPD
jgi:hypothetical protein